jgi:hypothetical protein
MPSDEDIARRSLDLQQRARDIPLTQIPGYMAWSEYKLAQGESEALIAHLDATSMWLLPEDVETVSTSDFDEMLDDLKTEIKRNG